MSIEQIIWIIVLLVLFYSVYSINKVVLKKDNYKVLNPISIMIGIWTITIIVHANIYEYENYSFGIYLSLAVGLLLFSMGFWATHNKVLVIGHEISISGYNIEGVKKVLRVFTLISFARCLYMTYTVYRVAGSLQLFLAQNTFVRILYLSRQSTFQTYIVELPLSMLTMIGFVILGIYLGLVKSKGIKYLLIWTVLEFIVAYVTMSKLNMIIYVFAVMFTYLNFAGGVKNQKKFIRRVIPILAIALVMFLYVVANQRNYQFIDSSFLFIMRKAFMYIASPLEAFGRFLDGYRNNHQIVMNVVDVGDGQTNVFTWYKPFVQHASYFGIAIFPFLLGAVAGFVYNNNHKTLFWVTASTWTNCMVFMSFYSYLWVHLSYLVCIPLSLAVNVIISKKIYSDNLQSSIGG